MGAASLWRERRINKKLATVIALMMRITRTKSLTWDAGVSVLGSVIAKAPRNKMRNGRCELIGMPVP